MQQVELQATVPDELAGHRLDKAASQLFADYSRSRLKQWIEGGQLTVDGCSALPRQRLKGGESLELKAQLEAVIPLRPEAIPLAMVYEDKDLFVIDKPAGLVVHPGAGNHAGTLMNALLFRDPELAAVPRAGIVHRLDKDTSGLLVVARNLTVQQLLVAQIESREVQRVYQAVCQGVLTAGGVVDAPIDRHPRDRTRMAVRQGGREARTIYRVLDRFRAQTLVELTLDTGRTHQIRVHMAHIRAPLVGDPDYGGRPRLPRKPQRQLVECLQAFPRQALHAVRLAFSHPVSGEALVFQSPLPTDLSKLIAELKHDRDRA
jgi:23S rRNA pseudouridine1911/1915/1917 synthase